MLTTAPRRCLFLYCYHMPLDFQKLRRHMTSRVRISNRPSSMDKHRMLFAKSDKFAYVHVAPVIPKAGPMQPMVLTLMPTASKMFP